MPKSTFRRKAVRNERKNFRFTEATVNLLEWLSVNMEVSHTEIVEQAVKRYATAMKSRIAKEMKQAD